MKHRDRAYWQDVWHAFFLKGDCGKYRDKFTAFAAAHPGFREFVEHYAGEAIEEVFIKATKRRFREADMHEHEEPTPTPPHLRQQFLAFDIEAPPMAPTLNAFDGQGRVTMSEATPS